MHKHRAKADDCIDSIAFEYGLTRDKIWNDAANQQLRQLRDHPNLLCDGDYVAIPDKSTKQENAETELRHRFRKMGDCHIHIRFLNWDEKPRVGIPYILIVDTYKYEGETDSSGELRHLIPPSAREGMLMLGEQREERYQLKIGLLDPIEEWSGIQARLVNLSFMFSPVDGAPGPCTENAIRAFQGDHSLNPTGKLDDNTRQKIREIYGT